MPHILVFTTDLDAQMLYRKRWRWRSIRNLVVASHFDLRLRETKDDKSRDDKNEDEKTHFSQRSYQDQFPPFRDSQQTNIFYRTLSIAAGDAKGIEESETTSHGIFEVGRNGFVRLGNTGENTAKQLGLLFAITVSLIFFRGAIRPHSRQSTLFLLGGTFVIFAIAWFFAMDKSGEPLSFTDGISLWSTLFIQIIAISLAVWFIFQAMFELEVNFCRLSVRHFPNDPPSFPVSPGECELWVRRRWRFLRLWLRVRGLSVSGWITFVVLIGSIIVYAWNDVDPSGFFSFWCCVIILAVLASFYQRVIEFKNNVSIKHWTEAENWGHPPQVNHESVLWEDYNDYGRFGPRIARVVWIWLIFAIIETLLVYLLPPWPLPWRGATDWASQFEMARCTGVLSFTVTMLLLFFILDAVRLNFYWIKKLRTQHPLLTGHVPGRLGYILVRAQLARLEDIVSLVAERTRAVDKLIYYPMLCIMLILFAKITYFDNQDFPLSKGITFGAAISFLFLSGFVLRREANELRLCTKKSVWALRVNNAVQGIDETVSENRRHRRRRIPIHA